MSGSSWISPAGNTAPCQCSGFSLLPSLICVFNCCILAFNLLCAENKYNVHAISEINFVFYIWLIGCLAVYSECVAMGEGAKLNRIILKPLLCHLEEVQWHHQIQSEHLRAVPVVLWTTWSKYLCIYTCVNYLYKSYLSFLRGQKVTVFNGMPQGQE